MPTNMTTKTNLIVDTGIFAAFLVAFEPRLTGIAIHEWLSLALAATILVHLLLHWRWIVSVTFQYFRKLFHESRLNYLVDLGLLVAFVTLMLSGILISESVLPTLGLPLAASQSWRFIHSLSADLSLALVGLHFALHWKWIVHTLKRFVFKSLKTRLARQRPKPVLTPVSPLPVDEQV